MLKVFGLGLLLLAVLGVPACEAGPPVIDYEITATLPHDPAAYTQGLLFHDGFLYESTGRYGASNLRKVHAQSGRVVASIAVKGHPDLRSWETPSFTHPMSSSGLDLTSFARG